MRATMALAAFALASAATQATPPGFLTDPQDALRQAQSQGKLVFVSFHLNG